MTLNISSTLSLPLDVVTSSNAILGKKRCQAFTQKGEHLFGRMTGAGACANTPGVAEPARRSDVPQDTGSPDLAVAWAAGLFEGEGCITLSPQKSGGYQRSLTMVSTDRDVIDRFRAVFGVGSIRPRLGRDPRHKQQWQWRVDRWEDLEPTLRLMLPFFGERRRTKALELLAHPTRSGRFCLRNHPLVGPDADVRLREGRYPECRVCARIRSKRWYAARRQERKS